MAPVEVEDDYYAVLEVPRDASAGDVRKAYQRLAKLLHPDRNRGVASATASFQLLGRAYENIIDPELRRRYDVKWPGIRNRQQAQREAKEQQARNAEAQRRAEASAKAAAEKERAERQERLQRLRDQKRWYDDDVFEATRALRKVTADLGRLRLDEKEDKRREQNQNSWWAYLTSPLGGQAKETQEQKQSRETQRIQRMAAMRVKESDVKQKESRLQGLKNSQQDCERRIAAEQEAMAKEARQAEERRRQMMREQQEAQRRQEEARQEAQRRQERERQQREWADMMARMRREEEERAARQAAEERKRQARQEQEAEERREATLEAARKAREAREAATAARRRAEQSGFEPPSPSTCSHKSFWPQVDGQHVCSRCNQLTARFAFRCPSCKIVACASCRRILKGNRAGRGGPAFNRRARFDADDPFDSYGDWFD